MVYIKRFVIMLQFMTTIPLKADYKVTREDYGRGLAAAPLVGLVIGILLAGAYYLLSMVFTPVINAILTFAIYILLTGGLHMDGLGDTSDGLFSNRPRDRILQIMKDSRVGTNAVIMLILVILLDVSLIASFQRHSAVTILLLMPVAGRIGSLIGAGTSSYAGVSDGPGRWCVEYCRKRNIIAGLIAYIVISIAVLILFVTTQDEIVQGAMIPDGIALASGLLLIIIPLLTAIILTGLLRRKLDGVTGDVLGAICELNQLLFLLAGFAFSKLL